jgi:germination protein M
VANAGLEASAEKLSRMRRAFCIAIALVAAGCGGGTQGVDETPATTAPPPATTAETTSAARATSLELFFLASDGKLVADARRVEHTQAVGAATLHELLTPSEGTTTQVPEGLHLTVEGGRAQVTGAQLGAAALAQIVYSLTTFPTVQSVNGRTRAEVEDFAPAILVEHPAPHETVRSPLHVTGTANTFEATFDYRLEDAGGKVLAKNFVTATSGSGTRGTFDFTIPFTLDAPEDGTLAVFELSAEDGSIIHERDIPLRLLP